MNTLLVGRAHIPMALALAIWSTGFLPTPADAVPTSRLHPDLGTNRSAFDVLISPDHNWVVFTVANITPHGSSSYSYELDSIYSSPLSGGSAMRLDNPSEGPKTISSFAFDRPLISGDSQSVVFISVLKASNVATIYHSAIDGSELSPVPTFGGPLLGSPGWLSLTPDSERVVYRRSYIDDVVSVPLSGGDPIVLNPPRGPTGFTHNLYHLPDASRVMFVIGEDEYSGNRELFSVSPDGSNPTILSTTATNGDNKPVELNSVIVGSSSTHVLYRAGDLYHSEKANLFSVPIGGGPPVQLNPTSNDYLTLNGWLSPDGSRVVFDRWLAPYGPYDYFTVPVNGGTPLKLGGPFSTDEIYYPPVFTPDSKSVLLVKNAALPRLDLVSLETGERLQLNAPTVAGGDGISNVRFSPDGSTVAYIEDHDANGIRDLFLVPLAGGTPVRVNDPLPSMADVSSVEFSPDGHWISYHADTLFDEIRRAFIMQVDTSLPGFGLDQYEPIDVTLGTSETAFITLLAGNRALLEIGDTRSRELFLLRIPEPASLSLAVVLVCAVALQRQREFNGTGSQFGKK